MNVISSLCGRNTNYKCLKMVLRKIFKSNADAINIQLKVKVNVKVKVTLEQATKAQRGSAGIALLFL